MANTKVAELSIDDFKSLIRETVAQTIIDMLNGNEEDLELREDFSVELRQSLAEQFKKASAKSRSESLRVCEEFEAFDQIPN